MYFDTTIAAIATPPGSGAIGVVRISGLRAHEIADTVFFAMSGERLSDIKGYTARLGEARCDGARIDECVALVYRAPKSYTGEDAVELMCHGGELVCEGVLRALLDAGAEMAAAGEFTRRALQNGRITLTQAEAVCDLIAATSQAGERAAAALQGGALFRESQRLKEQVLFIQSHISAAIDFPEEDVEEIDAETLCTDIAQVVHVLDVLLTRYETGCGVLRGVPTAIVGSPNVGKSTLLNLLAGAPKAIVTALPGTTRDVLEQQVRLGGTTLLLCDTAGIRESDDAVEQLGIERALQRADEASLILAVFDASRPLEQDDRRVMEHVRGKKVVAIVNKTDLPACIDEAELLGQFGALLYISANDEGALPLLDNAVRDALGLAQFDTAAPLLANERQRACALDAKQAAEQALSAAQNSTLDVVSALLGEALAALMRLSGEDVTEELLDEVFSRFCVGK